MNSSLLCPLKIAQISRKGVQSFILQPQHPLHFQLQHPLPFPFILLTPASSPASLPSPYPQVAWAPSLVAALALLASPLERLKVLHPSGDIGVNVPSIGACSPPHQQSQPLVGRDLPPGVPHSAPSLGTWRECPFHRSLVSPLQFLPCIDISILNGPQVCAQPRFFSVPPGGLFRVSSTSSLCAAPKDCLLPIGALAIFSCADAFGSTFL
jgi:hypothetical protein